MQTDGAAMTPRQDRLLVLVGLVLLTTVTAATTSISTPRPATALALPGLFIVAVALGLTSSLRHTVA